jgi:hypothetical protein
VIEEIGREFVAAAQGLGRTDDEIARGWELVAGRGLRFLPRALRLTASRRIKAPT